MLSYNYQHLGIGRRTDETNSNTNATACDGDGYGENYHRWHGGPPQTKPKVRARRGQATDPHSIAERVRSFSSCFFFTPDYSCSVTKITVGSKLIIYVWA